MIDVLIVVFSVIVSFAFAIWCLNWSASQAERAEEQYLENHPEWKLWHEQNVKPRR